MGQDLRKLFEEEREAKKFQLKGGHEERFMERLESEMPKSKKPIFYFLKIAASVLVILSAAFFGYRQFGVNDNPLKTTVVERQDNPPKETGISLGDLSPDLRKIENYYVANINLELSKLEVFEENKIMVDGFMERLSELDSEYKLLNTELNKIGPNDQTINALIKNLQLRLQLLHKLKEKLNELKPSKNEHGSNTI